MISKAQIKYPGKNEFLWLVLCEKLVGLFWNTGKHVYRSHATASAVWSVHIRATYQYVANAMAPIHPVIVRMC